MDDGSKSVTESLNMLIQLKAQGVQTVVATPHFYPSEESPDEFLMRCATSFDKIQSKLDDKMPNILLGAEVAYFDGIANVAQIRDLKVQQNDLILVEMPFCVWTERMIENLRLLEQRHHVRVVLAHIERYQGGWTRYRQWKQILEGPFLTQVNASFFTQRKTAGKACKLLQQQKIDFIGSDCHNLTTRPPNIGEAVAVIEKHLGSDGMLPFCTLENKQR